MSQADDRERASADSPIEKLSNIVRTVSLNNEARDNHQRQASDHRDQQRQGSTSRTTPIPWDPQTGQERPSSRGSLHRRDSAQTQERDPHQKQRDAEREAREIQRDRIERFGSQSRPQQYNRSESHNRNESRENGGVKSSGEYEEPPNTSGRRHDYDVQSMETALSSPRASITKNPIPAPSVTVRSEYPTLTRSRQQQSLTCLITIEVPEGKWRPDPADLRGAPILPSMQQDSNTLSTSNRSASPVKSHQPEWQTESPEVLEEITEDLRVRVDNWHGLDFQRYAHAMTIVCQVLSLYATDLESYDSLVQCGWERTGNHGRNWNASSLLRCSSV